MAERDLIQHLDEAITAMLAGRADVVPSSVRGAVRSPEVTDLLRVAAHVRDLPSEEFHDRLKNDLMDRIWKEKQMTPTTKTSWIPEGFHTVTPYLHPGNAGQLIDFLKQTFGAEELERHSEPGGRIVHASVRIGDSILEMGEPPEPQPTSLRAYVHDVDEVYRRALRAGATSLYEPVDQSYGDREAGVKDPAGNFWFLARALNAGNYKHPGLQDVGVYLFPRGAEAFVDFLVKAFAAEIIGVYKSPEGVVMHADLKIGDSRILMGEAHGQWQPMPAGLHYYVPDVDAAYARAVKAGGQSVRPPQDQPYGERGASVDDPQGNHWYIATRTA